MAAGTIDAVLTFDGKQSGISTVRALKHLQWCLANYVLPDDQLDDKAKADLQVAEDDLELMLDRANGKR